MRDRAVDRHGTLCIASRRRDGLQCSQYRRVGSLVCHAHRATEPGIKRYFADARSIRRQAAEIMRQAAFYAGNGPGDELRFMLIEAMAVKLHNRARRAARRSGRWFR